MFPRKQKYFTRLPFTLLLEILFSVSLAAVNFYRILNIPITIDENGYEPEYTYISLLRSTLGYANNHILHSVIRKWFIETFSDNVFFYRVDSLIAQILFLFFSLLICRHLFKNKWWQLCAFITLNTISPLVFDFWGLSRGYALSLSLMTISIFYLLKYIEERRIFLLSFSFAAAFLSVFSNFGYINYFIALTGVVIIQQLIFKKTNDKNHLQKELAVLLISIIALTLLIEEPLRNVYQRGELAFLGTTGFINDTISSLVREGLFLPESLFSRSVIWFVTVFPVIGGCFWLFVYYRNNVRGRETPKEERYGIALFLLLIIPAISILLQHALLGVNFLVARTALFFIILFILNFIYLIYYIRSRVPKIAFGLLLVTTLLTGYNFVSKLNLNRTILWWFDSDDLNVLTRIANEWENKNEKIKVKAYWLFTASFRYDINHFYKNRFYPVEALSGPPDNDTTFDYYYIPLSDVSLMDTAKFRQDTAFVISGFILYRKK